jgi:thiamine transport system ATP-binding protein
MLEVEDVTTNLDALKFNWTFNVAEQSMLAVTGNSGIGKSTLLNTLLGIQPLHTGRIVWNGTDISQLPVKSRPFGVLFQKDNLFEHLTVERNLSFGFSPSGKFSAEQQIKLKAAAERFQIIDLLKQRCSTLSGGQQQRVALARVFLQNKPILLLDEPFSSLDPDLRLDGLNWVTELQAENKTTVIMVTHHLDEIVDRVDEVLEGVSSSHWKQYSAR